MHRRIVRAICCAPTVVLLSGCYEYVAPRTGSNGVGPLAPPTGTAVRVELTDAGTASLASAVGPGVTSLTGRLVSANDSAVTVAVDATVKRNGLEDFWKGENVVVRRSEVAAFQEKAFSRTKTAVASGIAVGLAAIFYAALGGSLGGGSGGTPGGGTPK
jgi:hypothetical protein